MIREIEQKLDKIVIDRKEFEKIRKYRLDNNPNSNNEWSINGKFDSRMFFPLNNFILDCDCKGYRMYGLMELKDFNPLNFTYTDDNGVLEVRRRTESHDFEINYEAHDKSKKILIPCTPKEWTEIIVVTLTSIMVYIIDKAEERRREERLSPELERKQREDYEYKERELFFLNDIIKYRKIHHNRKSIQYRCECWGVRGHLRHYTNGKVVFIEPYKKGRKRDVLEPKSNTYLLGNK